MAWWSLALANYVSSLPRHDTGKVLAPNSTWDTKQMKTRNQVICKTMVALHVNLHTKFQLVHSVTTCGIWKWRTLHRNPPPSWKYCCDQSRSSWSLSQVKVNRPVNVLCGWSFYRVIAFTRTWKVGQGQRSSGKHLIPSSPNLTFPGPRVKIFTKNVPRKKDRK